MHATPLARWFVFYLDIFWGESRPNCWLPPNIKQNFSATVQCIRYRLIHFLPCFRDRISLFVVLDTGSCADTIISYFQRKILVLLIYLWFVRNVTSLPICRLLIFSFILSELNKRKSKWQQWPATEASEADVSEV
jgi:hypothetical protein